MNIKDTTEPTLSQYQAYNGDWCDFLDEQHYLDTVAEGKCRVRHLYAAPQPVIAPLPPLSDERTDAMLSAFAAFALIAIHTPDELPEDARDLAKQIETELMSALELDAVGAITRTLRRAIAHGTTGDKQ
jgi:hypothetical protein